MSKELSGAPRPGNAYTRHVSIGGPCLRGRRPVAHGVSRDQCSLRRDEGR